MCSHRASCSRHLGLYAVSGTAQDRYLEYYLTRGLGGKCYGTLGALAEERRHRRVCALKQACCEPSLLEKPRV